MPSGFLFEPEVPYTSLKNVPTWTELEQLLDNPYAVSYDPSTPGNDQGFPSYRATGITRRKGFGVTLPALLVHPLNYNPTTGEEMRLINPLYPGGTFDVIDQLVEGPPGTFTWTQDARDDHRRCGCAWSRVRRRSTTTTPSTPTRRSASSPPR